MIIATLAPDAALRRVFTDGTIPLSRPGTVRAKLGDSESSEFVYLMATRQCTPQQIDGMADLMVEMGQGTKEEALEYLRENTEVPVRQKNVSSVAMPLRSFI